MFRDAVRRRHEAGETPNDWESCALAAAFFSACEHVGSFLPTDDHDAGKSPITRVARALPGTRGIEHVLLFFGRHPIVHDAWPRPYVYRAQPDWAFGLDLSIDDKEASHNCLYSRDYQAGNGEKSVMLRLVINLHVLFQEFKQLVGTGHVETITAGHHAREQAFDWNDVTNETFAKIQEDARGTRQIGGYDRVLEDSWSRSRVSKTVWEAAKNEAEAMKKVAQCSPKQRPVWFFRDRATPRIT